MRFLFCICCIFLAFHSFAQVSKLYTAKDCVSCHGSKAEGNETLKAPALAGQNYAYLKRQLENFQNRVRGEHSDDYTGKVMWALASALTPAEIEQISKALSELPPAKNKISISGYPAKGAAFYGTCVACHGEKGEGNDALGAPNLTVLQPWYIVEQLQKFKKGLRGSDPAANPFASQMLPMAMIVPGVEEMEDLALYIKSLGEK